MNAAVGVNDRARPLVVDAPLPVVEDLLLVVALVALGTANVNAAVVHVVEEAVETVTVTVRIVATAIIKQEEQEKEEEKGLDRPAPTTTADYPARLLVAMRTATAVTITATAASTMEARAIVAVESGMNHQMEM